MNIVYASSNEYAPHTGISLFSLLVNNVDIDEINIYIIDNGISNENKSKMLQTCEKFHRKLEFVDGNEYLNYIGNKLGLPKFRNSYSPYSKAFMYEIMPKNVKRLIYIDSDTIVNGSLKEINELDMGNKVMASVVGVNCYYKHNNLQAYDMDLAKKTIYHNSGFILYDFVNWEKNNCSDLIINGINTDPHFDIADQTILSAYIPSEMKIILPLEYNYWGHIYPKTRIINVLTSGNFYSKKDVKKAKKNPIVIHYKGLYFHPWVKGSLSSLKKIYIYFKKKSFWADEPFENIKDYLKKPETGLFKNIRKYKPIFAAKVPFEWMITIKRIIKK